MNGTRLCAVNGEHGYFHTWEHYSKPLPASPLVGGEPSGVFSKVFAIVEFKDGVRRVDPAEIQFCVEENAALSMADKGEGRTKVKDGLEADITNIRDILMRADAVSCDVTGYKPQLYGSNVLFEIPSGYSVTVNYNKLAKALYDAGYRKEDSHDR